MATGERYILGGNITQSNSASSSPIRQMRNVTVVQGDNIFTFSQPFPVGRDDYDVTVKARNPSGLPANVNAATDKTIDKCVVYCHEAGTADLTAILDT